jgi:hypothetical protein
MVNFSPNEAHILKTTLPKRMQLRLIFAFIFKDIGNGQQRIWPVNNNLHHEGLYKIPAIQRKPNVQTD